MRSEEEGFSVQRELQVYAWLSENTIVYARSAGFAKSHVFNFFFLRIPPIIYLLFDVLDFFLEPFVIATIANVDVS